MADSYLLDPAKQFYDSLSDDDCDEIDRILWDITHGANPSDGTLHTQDLGAMFPGIGRSIVLRTFTTERFRIGFHVMDDGDIEVYALSDAPGRTSGT